MSTLKSTLNGGFGGLESLELQECHFLYFLSLFSYLGDKRILNVAMIVPISVLYLPTVLKCKLWFQLKSMTDKLTCDTHLQSKYIGCCSEYYFTAVTWVSVTEVSVVWMNRQQNLSLVTVCKIPMWYCQEVNKLSPL